jgi:uncharacterized membrane protein
MPPSPTPPAARSGPDDDLTPASDRKPVSPSRIVVKGDAGIKSTRAVTIRQPASLLYSFWRDVENLMRISKHPVTIRRQSDLQSHWLVSAPGDRRVEWDAVIINDHTDRLIAWRSREDAEIPNAGTVRFDAAPGDEGTEVTVVLEYNPPAGKLGAWLAKLTGEEAGQQVEESLRRFKALMETGEIPTVEGQASGRAKKAETDS